jgi:SAM-dependent methyltransferase
MSACTVCRSSATNVLVSIANQPVCANQQWSTAEAAFAQPRGDLDLRYCTACGHTFNASFNPALVDYALGYENSLHFSPSFERYAESLAERLVAEHQLQNMTVLEIGCGNGQFLQRLCDLGNNRGIGVDPSLAAPRTQLNDRVTLYRDLACFDLNVQAVDFICCRHVLEHVVDPVELLQGIRTLLDGRDSLSLYFEVPNADYSIRRLGIWDFIYEHVQYFSATSLSMAFHLAGFNVDRVYPSFGGQFLVIEASLPTQAASLLSPIPDVEARQHAEIDVKNFSQHYHAKIAQWRVQLQELKLSGQKAAVWGGGSKGVSFINVFSELGAIDVVIDLNPSKQGKYIPGAGLIIRGPEDLINSPPDVVIVMNPLYRDEIQRKLATMGLYPAIVEA